MKQIALGILLALSTITITSCAPDLELESPGLANRGILPLSTTDPYLGSNIFLSREMERSTYLHNFLRTRGGPTAIELTQEYGRPPHMVMFYPRTREVYAAERVLRIPPGQKTQVREWIVRGPYAIERKDYRELAGLDSALNGEPVFVVWGKQQRFKQQREEADPFTPEKVVKPILPPTPPPTPKPTPKKKPAPVIKARGDDIDEAEIQNYKNLNSDQRALQIAKGYAERGTNGDVIHSVARENETLPMISSWYTGAATNAAEIATINNLSADQIIPKGVKVRIPLKLLKKVKTMPLDYKG